MNKGQVFTVDTMMALLVVTTILSTLLVYSTINQGDYSTMEGLKAKIHDARVVKLYEKLYSSQTTILTTGSTILCEDLVEIDLDANTVINYVVCDGL